MAIRPRDGVLAMETMLFADEVIPPDSLDELPRTAAARRAKRELEMAQQLIESLSADFEPEQVPRRVPRARARDDRAQGGRARRSRSRRPTEEPQKVPDLMAALEASIAAAKGPSAGGSKKKSAPAAVRTAPSSTGKKATAKK